MDAPIPLGAMVKLSPTSNFYKQGFDAKGRQMTGEVTVYNGYTFFPYEVSFPNGCIYYYNHSDLIPLLNGHNEDYLLFLRQGAI